MATTPPPSALYAVYARPGYFMHRSGLWPLAEAVGASPIHYDCFWRKWGSRHWRLEHLLRRIGQLYYGSAWNDLIPWFDEQRIASKISAQPSVVHFLFAEFASPRRQKPFRKRQARIVGTFHTSPRRLEQVAGHMRLPVYDAISVVSNGQRNFFLDRGVSEDRIFLTHHGVDTRYFSPNPTRQSSPTSQPLRGLMVGDTERDHDFAAELMKALQPGTMELSVATRPYPHRAYRGIASVHLLPQLSDHDLLMEYQQADLLVMPLLDATSNNAILESMACGTPVLTNRTCGTPDYLDPTCNYIMDGKCIQEWVDRLEDVSGSRDVLAANRASVRKWVEKFDWSEVAAEYHALYDYARKCPLSP